MSDAMPTPDQPDETRSAEEIVKETIDQDVTEAREAFTLVDMFAGAQRKLPTKTRLIFRDIDAAEAYQDIHGQANILRGMLEEKLPAKATAEQRKQRAELEEALVDIEAREAEAKEKMYAGLVVFHLRAYPRIAQKVAKKEARKIFLDPKTGEYHEGVDQDDVNDWLMERLFGDMVVKVTDSVGNTIDFGVPKSELGSALANGQGMHPAHWDLLTQDYHELSFRAGMVTAGLEDPGF